MSSIPSVLPESANTRALSYHSPIFWAILPATQRGGVGTVMGSKGLLAVVMANKETCKETFRDIAYLINRSADLEAALRWLYSELDIKVSLKMYDISKEDLKQVAFHASRKAVTLATDPASPSQSKILELLRSMYE